MLKKILRFAGYAVVAIAAIGALLYATRSNPMGPISGRALRGELVATPVSDWSFTDEHNLIAVETRPDDPHSVTTICFVIDGALYVPAQGGSDKDWTQYAVANPSARILVDGKIYPVRATRVTEESLVPAFVAAAAKKYDFPADREMPEDVWLFRMDSAQLDVAAP